MPELPEVEVSRLTLLKVLPGLIIEKTFYSGKKLRKPLTDEFFNQVSGKKVNKIERRGKYLLFFLTSGSFIVHLGMSGSLRLLTSGTPGDKHDHVIFSFNNGLELRYNDPRRFGLILYGGNDPYKNSLLDHLGPEPLEPQFNAEYLTGKCVGRTRKIKNLIMDSRIVVGIGNIYASEALFLAGINPLRTSGSLSEIEQEKLIAAIKSTLQKSLAAGGSTIKDFINPSGSGGYFQQQLAVYNRAGKKCGLCSQNIVRQKIGGRASYYCPGCQPMG